MLFLTLLSLFNPAIGKAENKIQCLTSAVIAVESDGNPNAVNETKLGVSHGIMQIQLSTARDMGFRGKLEDLYKPVINKIYGIRYIQWLLKRYNGDALTALDAYNRGIKKVEDFPYKKEWTKHRYVGLILTELKTLCPQYYAELVPTH
jgi:soluble lytic murein transglycosylase-like protein